MWSSLASELKLVLNLSSRNRAESDTNGFELFQGISWRFAPHMKTTLWRQPGCWKKRNFFFNSLLSPFSHPVDQGYPTLATFGTCELQLLEFPRQLGVEVHKSRE
uniref:Uncharacterized protein n=1 Tax=Micrurus corallinus TaxID=54390 RepID=A0A2D4F910_MICCO